MAREINEQLNKMKLGWKLKMNLHKLNPEDIVKPRIKGMKSKEPLAVSLLASVIRH